MKEMPINELIRRCKTLFEESHYSRRRISVYGTLWKKGILRHMGERGCEIYSPDVGRDFISATISAKPADHQEQELVRSINVLDDCLLLGRIRMRCHTPVVHQLHGAIGEHMQPLIDHLREIRRSETTIKDYQLYLDGFSGFLVENGVKTPDSITLSHLFAFIKGIDQGKGSILSAIRVLFRFWFDNGITRDDKSDYLALLKYVRKERIPSFYEKEEVMRIESSVDRTGAIGKRDYAMLLLASRLGLRASDIAGMKLDDIGWRNSEISLVQYKTKNPITLPLLADVGNAIIDYLRNGRQKSNLDNLFLSARTPYRAVSRQGVCAAINKIISTAGINLKTRRHGPHSMRHSLATAMMQNGTSMPTISEALGHASTQTTLTYLKIDMQSLQKCALPVPPVDEAFYRQKGGAFYE